MKNGERRPEKRKPENGENGERRNLENADRKAEDGKMETGEWIMKKSYIFMLGYKLIETRQNKFK